MGQYSFKRKEHLKSKKHIALLFQKRQSVGVYPFRLFWMEVATTEVTDSASNCPFRIAFSVPKKNFRKAHDRNAIRRRMHEVYRLQKPELYEALRGCNKKLVGLLLYVARDNKVVFTHMQQQFRALAERLLNILDQNQANSTH